MQLHSFTFSEDKTITINCTFSEKQERTRCMNNNTTETRWLERKNPEAPTLSAILHIRAIKIKFLPVYIAYKKQMHICLLESIKFNWLKR